MTGQFDLQQFMRRADGVAAVLPSGELFGLLRRSFNLPAQWAALVTRETGDDLLVAPGAKIDGDDVDQVMITRVSPVEVRVDDETLVSQDRFQCEASVSLRLRAIAERSELRSLRDAVLGSYRIATAANLARFLQPVVRTALARVAQEMEAAELTAPSGLERAADAVLEALRASCFAAGLVIETDPVVTITSQTFARVRQQEEADATRRRAHDASRQLQLALEQAQLDHADHLSELLGRLNEMAAASPEVALNDLVRTFSEKQRGELYEALFTADAVDAATAWIVVAAGEELLYFDPQRLEQPVRRLRIAGSAGPLRSIQTALDGDGRRVLLIGAATGVYRVPVDRAEPDLTLLAGSAGDVRGGFNAVATVGDRVFATHSELGLLEWNTKEPTRSRRRFADLTSSARVVRGVTFHQGQLYASIDNRIIRWPADDRSETPEKTYTGSSATISSVIPAGDGLFAGTSEGDVLHWGEGRTSKPQRLHTGNNRAVESLWALDAHGVRRLVYADTSPRIHVRVVGDSFVCQYEAGGQTLRRVEVAPDLLVATNDLRDRLICWTPGRPERPKNIVSVAQLTGRSIQDVCLIPHA